MKAAEATLVAALVIVAVSTAPTRAQAPAPPQSATLPSAAVSPQEAAALAQGWVLLAERKFDEAASRVRTVTDRFPRSVGALALLIDVEIARAGATTALAAYEAWIGGRSLEEPSALRRVARAFLYEWSRQTTDQRTRDLALTALAEDGDEAARAVIAEGGAGPAIQARFGDVKAVELFVARLSAASGSKVNEIQLLAETGSRRAATPLMPLLDDPLPANRAAAAAALGKLEHREAVPALRRLLQDPQNTVRVAAAGALYQMGDTTGAPVLDELATNEHASIRRSAALLMASQPSETWKRLVRGLASDEDAATRLDAARLLAPHDPEFARSILEALAGDSNPVIREQAASVLAESPASGLQQLRQLLRTGAGPVKVRAARSILQATR